MTYRCSSRRSSLEELQKIQHSIKGTSMINQGQDTYGMKSQILIGILNQKDISAQKDQTQQQQQYQSFSPFRSILRDHQDQNNNNNINHRSTPSTEYLQQSQQQQSSCHSSLKKPVPIIRRFSSAGLPPPVELQYQQQQLPEQTRQSSQNKCIIQSNQISRYNENNQHNQSIYYSTSQQQQHQQQIFLQSQQNQQLLLNNQQNPIDYLTARDIKQSNNHQLLIDQAITVRMDINRGKKYRSLSQTAFSTTTSVTQQQQQQHPVILLLDPCIPHSESVKPQQTIHPQISQHSTLLLEQQQQHYQREILKQQQQSQIQILHNYKPCQNTATYQVKPEPCFNYQQNQNGCLTSEIPLFSKAANHTQSIYQSYDINITPPSPPPFVIIPSSSVRDCQDNNINIQNPTRIQTAIQCDNNSTNISINDHPISTIASHDDTHYCEIPQLDLQRIPSFSFFPQETTKRSKQDDGEGDAMEVYQYKKQSRRSSCSQLFIAAPTSESTSQKSQNLLKLQDNNVKKIISSDDSICSAYQSISDTTATIKRITNHKKICQNNEFVNNTECSQEQYEHVILPTTEGSVQESLKQFNNEICEKEILSSQDTKKICFNQNIISRLTQQKIQDNQYDQEFKQIKDKIKNTIENNSNLKITTDKENIIVLQDSNSNSSRTDNHNNNLSNVQRLMGQIKRVPVRSSSSRQTNQEQKKLKQQQQQPTAVEQLYSKLQSLNNSYLRLNSQIQESIKQQTSL